MPTTRIYVACLSSYNAGRLFGRWIDTEDLDAEDLGELVAAMLAASPIPNAEEFAIHDHEGFPPQTVGEYSSLSEVAELSAAIHEHGDAFIAALQNFCGSNVVESALDYLADCYRGVFESLADYEYQLAQDTGSLESVPAWLEYHIDWESVARDSQAVGFLVNHQLHVFCS